ncbi:PAS domain S-box-containing protein [Filimonas lacunae]|uniref:histidine kinase n=2 Tax=Filimonas lacunae TaxID=477680 RepID=A0A173MEW5_9BACT|nr:phytochrome, two-component sensor histidine kinase [Filimonas lacunae]SIT24454.1 PAS domain S-box-containing protein [Filimonas lacunae]
MPAVFNDNTSRVSTASEVSRDTEVFLKYGTWENYLENQTFWWSNGMYILFGYDPADKETLHISTDFYYSHMYPEDVEQAQKIRQSWESFPGYYSWDFRIKDRQGNIKVLESNARMIRDANGVLVKVVGTTRDITDLRTYQRGLEAKIQELNRSNKELEEFAYIASHDLQEPLRKFNTFGERLQVKYSAVLEKDGNFYLDRMMAAAQVMRELIDNLLDYSRISGNNHEFSRVSLPRVIADVLSNLELQIEESNAVVEVEPLPEIEAIPLQMQQLFTNLISNAIKFSNNQPSPLIQIKAGRPQPEELLQWPLLSNMPVYKITVKDNGIGFDQEDAIRIFQIFQRLHGKAEYKGSGIGLSICKRILEVHNGVIYAESEPGKGASFIILIPEIR